MIRLPVLLLLLVGCSSSRVVPRSDVLTFADNAVQPWDMPFVAHDNYLALNLPFVPYHELLRQTSELRNLPPIIDRGEAHVTVVSPPEYALIKDWISIQEINAMATDLQKFSVEPVCVAEGHAQIEGQTEKTYFVVIRSPQLVALRQRIEARVREKSVDHRGGNRTVAFAAEHFYPHVTLGFTKMDLHEEQGVIKDEHACILRLQAKK